MLRKGDSVKDGRQICSRLPRTSARYPILQRTENKFLHVIPRLLEGLDHKIAYIRTVKPNYVLQHKPLWRPLHLC